MSSPSPPPVRLLPLAPSPVGVDLLRRAGGEPKGEPFLRLDAGTGGPRAYAAVLRSATGAVLDRLLVELPGEEREEAPFPDEEALSNRALEEEWEAARRDRERLLAAPDRFPALVLPAAEPEGGAPLLPPLWFCPAAGRLFPIVCPRCRGPLRTCRDDARLAAAGLPVYSTTAARFLHCPACGEGEDGAGEPRFWAGPAAEARGLAGVATLEDLRRELAELPPAPGAPQDEGRAPLAPATPVSGWTVFNLHDSPYRITRQASVGFDAFVERLGGATPGDGEEAAGPGLLFAAEGSGIDAVEILALKLTAFLQVVGALRQHHLLLGRAHLDLQPQHLAVEPGPSGDRLPHLWSFRVKLSGASSARSARLGPTTEVLLPPRAPRAPFASPALRAAGLATPATGELLIERVVAEKGEKGEKGRKDELWRLEGTLLDAHGFYPAPAPRDRIQLALPRDLLGSVRTAVAQLDPRQPPQGVEIAVTTEPLPLEPAVARRLGRAGGFRVPGVRYRIYPVLSAPEDLYSLGVLLLGAVLVNDGQALSALEPLIEAVSQGRGAARRGALPSVEEALAATLAAAPGTVAKANLFHRSVDRTPGRSNALPDDLWTGVLRLALRLVARGPGFGLTAEPGGSFAFDETHPATHLDAVRAAAEDLLRPLHAILFERQTVHAEIRAALAELLGDELDRGRQEPAPAGRARA